ncbi:leucine-rich repeats and immunoglobulin-like domains protein 2 [Culicoides brevitarsis]|uniref:leucine-rich repeats and immunoglobulin-like domains protein 2 n=1 Tax=Culicoides brevitarsis TaxID=469753 RepID=UPI00307C0EDE
MSSYEFLVFVIFLVSFPSQIRTFTKEFQCRTFSGVCLIPYEKGDFSNISIAIPVPLHTVDLIPYEVTEMRIESHFGRIPETLVVNFPKIQILRMPNTGLKSLELVETLAYLRDLDVEGNNLTELGNADLGFSLEKINARKNQISKIRAGSLEYLERLEELNLSDNFITSLDEKVFKYNKELKVLLLENNEIESMDGVFTPGLKLQRISLSKNFIKSISPNTFLGLTELRELDLSRNLIQTVDENAFRTNNALLVLNLRHNYMTSFFLDVNSTDFYLLHLGDNQLEAVFIITQLEKVHFLSIFAGNNRIQQFHVQKNIPLMILDLSSNFLSLLQPFHFNEGSVDTLKISNNNFSTMDFNHLRRFKNLRELHLNNTSLNERQFAKILNKLTELQVLDVSFNENLAKFNFTTVMALKLKDLKLNACNLRKLHPKEMRHGMPNLMKLGISGNKFKCNKTEAMLEKLKKKNAYQILVELVETGPTVEGIGCEM